MQFNDAWAWETLQDFAIDTSAVAVAGAGLAAKIGLGKRVAGVLGVKTSPITGTIIDAVIDLVGSTITKGFGFNPSDKITEILNLIGRTESAIAPLGKAGANLIRATTALGAVIFPLLPTGPPSIGQGLKVVIALPAIVTAAVNVFGAIMSFWAVAEPLIPELPPGRIDLPLDPQFRQAAKKFAQHQIFPLDPGFRGETSRVLTAAERAEQEKQERFKAQRDATQKFIDELVGPPPPLPTIQDPPTDPGDPAPPPPVFDPILLPGGGVKIPPPTAGLPFITAQVAKRSPGDTGPARVVFTRRFANAGPSDLLRIIEELKKRG